MYLHLELKTMAISRLDEAVARLHYLHTLMAATQGFEHAEVCEYLGNPAQYLVVRTWRDRRAHMDYRASQAAKDFAASRPPGFIYDNLAVQEWDCLLDTVGAGKGGYLVRRLEPVGDSAWDAYVEQQAKRHGWAARLGSAASLRTYRMLPNESGFDARALSLETWADRASYVAFLQSTPGLDDRAEGPGDINVTVECYRVVDEVSPAA